MDIESFSNKFSTDIEAAFGVNVKEEIERWIDEDTKSTVNLLLVLGKKLTDNGIILEKEKKDLFLAIVSDFLEDYLQP